jgi:hypothetical protein
MLGGVILLIVPPGVAEIALLGVLDDVVGTVVGVVVAVLVGSVPGVPLAGWVAAERAVTGGTGAAAVVAGTGEVLAVAPDGFSASLTRATLSTASDAMIKMLETMIGVRQLAGAARRVRAAAPQPRHQS